jgi:RNA recognition motif-containing protein
MLSTLKAAQSLVVSRLPRGFSKEEVRQHFGRCGAVEGVAVVSKDTAYVTFTEPHGKNKNVI